MTPSPELNPKYFVLQTGDVIEQGDQYYNPVQDQWLPVQAEFVGDEWNDDESKPVRRLNPDHQAVPEYDGTRCPKCGSDSINGDNIEPSGADAAYRNVDCNDCGATWTEELKVVGFDHLTEEAA